MVQTDPLSFAGVGLWDTARAQNHRHGRVKEDMADVSIRHIVQLLQNTTNSNDTRRRGAEDQLQELYHNAEFAPVLCTIAASDQAALSVRQSALLVLKNAVLAGWSDSLDEFRGEFLFNQSSSMSKRQTRLTRARSSELSLIRWQRSMFACRY